MAPAARCASTALRVARTPRLPSRTPFLALHSRSLATAVAHLRPAPITHLSTAAPLPLTSVTATPFHAPSTLSPTDKALASNASLIDPLAPLDVFSGRHIGPDTHDVREMLSALGYPTLDAFVDDTVPRSIRLPADTLNDAALPALSETQLAQRARELASKNKPYRSFIGMGYHNAVVPPVILRNILENPAWYTPYTPYQAEIAQGRLESLVNFQTMVMSLTSMHIANASLLDEGTAAAEAMAVAFAAANMKRKTFLVDTGVLPQTKAILHTRAKGFGIKLVEGDVFTLLKDKTNRADLCGVLVQYPDVDGRISNFASLASEVHAANALVACATDLLALTMLKPPGEWGADIALGNSARFGVPAGYGGPHAAFFACTEKLKRRMPGRLIGRSRDVNGAPAYRLALQTREQHIRREKATSNICTSQALLANMAAMYAVYHGPAGLSRIAHRVHALTHVIADHAIRCGLVVENDGAYFDTLTLNAQNFPGGAHALHHAAREVMINLRPIDANRVGVTLDESVSAEDLSALINVFTSAASLPAVTLSNLRFDAVAAFSSTVIPSGLERTSDFLPHSVFSSHHSETALMRYIRRLESRDMGLVHAMIPLGSCTMKLNSASSMIPLTWKEFSNVHPFAPADQVQGYTEMIEELKQDLCKITGFHSCSLQPNSGASGEYAGLSVIRAYHESRDEGHRDVCLIPVSAHGTNPASAVMAGLKVIPVRVLPDGTLDLSDLRAKAEQHKDNLAAIMITYPSTFGVFEEGVQEACKIVHDHGGQVYLDGANLNAQIGLTNPAVCGGDVCHVNLHKTFAIPHGGGGPGMGPICVGEHLSPFLPSHPLVPTGGSQAIDAVSAAPFGSALVLLISWAYIRMLGASGLRVSSQVALMNANYIAERLAGAYSVRYTNARGRVAHEVLLDLAPIERASGGALRVADFAKRLQDYGFHPPTCSWPLTTALLIEPTESESRAELDRFCDAMLAIRREAQDVIDGRVPRENNLLRNAPHPVGVLALPEAKWDRPYSREQAAFPLPWLHEKKFWPTVGRIDDAYGDMNLVCDCPTVEELASS